MAPTETRWPCPVCLGVKMEKTRVGEGSAAAHASIDGPLVLDHCPRCGGVWFELGEVQRLKGHAPEALWAEIPPRGDRHRAQCHSCRSLIDRDAQECAACGAKTRLPCPGCGREMEQVRHGQLTLDVCKRCKGVWFDHHELEAVWAIERDKLVARRSRAGQVVETGSDVLLETLIWAPDLVFWGGHAAGAAIEAAGGLAGIGGAIADVAASVFETIVEIVSGVLG